MRALPVAIGVAVLAAACSGARPAAEPGTVGVVAAENVWGDVVAQIGGDHVRVTSIIHDAGTDPHEYETTVKDSAAVADAQLVVQNGLGYDDFVGRLMAASPSSQRRVVNIADVLGAHGDANPHLWYDLPRLADVARAIASQLGAIDPAHAAVYDANAARFTASLAPSLATVARIRVKYGHSPVAYTERVAGYLLDAAGLDVRTPPGFARAIEDGNEPSPGDADTLERLLDQHGVRVLLTNPQASSPAIGRVLDAARRAGIATVAMTETIPSGQRFQDWQKTQLDALVRALGG